MRIGIDLESISRVQGILNRKPRFAERILTPNEMLLFREMGARRQAEFLTGRFSAKEAYSKAVGTGIGKLTFQDIEILGDEKGNPQVTKSPFHWKSDISITHAGDFAAAAVILEEDENG
ncbi:MAG: holo-ACP synthase [Streptococcaceae bacterium]|jgi:holo-[acyl-carrier protein] synthase|nr:holo-ACP synthase [Streptococcaceae bacterium]